MGTAGRQGRVRAPRHNAGKAADTANTGLVSRRSLRRCLGLLWGVVGWWRGLEQRPCINGIR
eukprot:gene8918-biopygen8543